MAKVFHANAVAMNTATTGTGTITVSTVLDIAHITAAQAGVVDGQTYAYKITDGNDIEFGTTVAGGTATTFTRVLKWSKIGGSYGVVNKINLSGSAIFRIIESAEDIDGKAEIGNPNTFTAAQTISVASTSALTVGPNGANNPTLAVDSSTASAATGVLFKGAAAGGGVAISAISSGTNENLLLDAKGSGTITIGSVSTGLISLNRNTAVGGTFGVSGATTLSSALTYGGVTLSNAVTGTGNMVLSASPTVTGTLTAATINASGVATISNATASTSTTTGALVVTGGAGFGGQVSAAGFAAYQRSDVAPHFDASGAAAYSVAAGGNAQIVAVGGYGIILIADTTNGYIALYLQDGAGTTMISAVSAGWALPSTTPTAKSSISGSSGFYKVYNGNAVTVSYRVWNLRLL